MLGKYTQDPEKGFAGKLSRTRSSRRLSWYTPDDSEIKKGVVKGAFGSSNDDLKSKFKVRLSCATEADKKQKIRIKVEFLDGDGTVMDRLVQDVNLKNEAKVFEFEHTILTWVVPHITQASITVSRND